MAFISQPAYRVTISGDAVDCTDVTLVWELGAVVPTSCDIEIVIPSGAAPAVREAVDVRIADLQFARSWPVFTGNVQKTIATSEPNRVVVRCLDELALLRDTWDGDTDFTGNTDGDVVKQAMDASGITYAPGNIQDAGYQLGAIAQVPIVGTARTARSEIVKSLNEMLRMALVTIGGTPVRFHYSLVPDADAIVKTFTRSETTDFWGNERTRGGLDDLRNIVRVTGPTFNCDGDGDEDSEGSCRCSLWSRASAGNVALGSGVRTEPVPIRFDAAQDQDILEWIAEEELKERNRVADLITVQTGFDPEIVIGHTIGVSDPIAGVNMVSDAVDKPYVVTRIEVKNFRATYQCVGGVAGDVDLVTSGVDKQCNKSVGAGTGITPGFTIPPITPPPTPSSTADGCVDLLDAAHLAGWAHPSEDLAHWTTEVGQIAIRSNVASGTPSQGRFTGFKVPANRAWRLTVGFHLHQSRAAIGFGISQSGSARDFSGSIAGSAFGAINETSARVFPTEDGHAGGVSVDVDHTAVLTWLPSTTTLTLEGIGADVTIVEPTATALWTIGAVPFLLANLASGGNTAIDAVVVTQYELCLIEDPGAGGGGAFALCESCDTIEELPQTSTGWSDGGASGDGTLAYDPIVFTDNDISFGPGLWRTVPMIADAGDYPESFCMEAEFVFLATDTDHLTFAVSAGSIASPGGWSPEYGCILRGPIYGGTGPLYAWAGGNYNTSYAETGPLAVDTAYTIRMQWNATTNVLDVTLLQGGTTVATVSAYATAPSVYDGDLTFEMAGQAGSHPVSDFARIDAVTVKTDCDGLGGAIVADWTALAGSWTFGADDEAHNAETADADAYANGHPFDGTERCVWTGHCDLNASDEVLLSWIMADTEGANTGNFAGIQAIVGASPALYVYTWNGFVIDLGTDLSGLGAGFDFFLDWNPAADTFSFAFVDSSDGSDLASGSYPLGAWPAAMTVHLAHGTGVTVDWDLTAMTIEAG